MKKILICAIALFCLTTSTTAQTAKEVQKQRKEIYKMSKEELNQKATKDARKAAKEYKKEGWKAAPGALPLEKQLDRLYLMRMEVDADMYPKYLTGEAMSIAESYDAAKIQAMELARLNLAGQLQSEVTALVENSVGNQQMSREEAASITQTIMESKALLAELRPRGARAGVLPREGQQKQGGARGDQLQHRDGHRDGQAADTPGTGEEGRATQKQV